MKQEASEFPHEMLIWSGGVDWLTHPEATPMAYPEPTPILRGKEARQFLQRWRDFKLTAEQQEFYRGARESYLASVEKARKPRAD